jgi:bifunctional non-homologous end joining protein LigD
MAKAKAASRKNDPAGALEDQLKRYREMRDFKVTAEPRGNKGAIRAAGGNGALPFVVQKHAATRLHYDFRLAWNGVLKSWAVAKGPSDLPADKRLAVQVEDHPIEYGNFEGTIPKGQYGGGSVMLWDFGEWEPVKDYADVDRALEEGHLKFDLRGQKMHGRWALVRMHTHDARPGKPNWLLIKDRDEFARTEDEPSITDRFPDSAISKRTIEQIGEASDRVWHSNRPADQQTEASRQPAPQKKTKKSKPSFTASLKSAPKEKFPNFIGPQLARASTAPPSGDGWIHELKLDGYRIQIQIRPSASSGKKRVSLLTRKGLDWTHRMPALARAAEQLPCESAVLDGEVVVLDQKGATSFADLQAAFQEGAKVRLTYFAFDLLHLDGHNLRNLPLLERKELLEKLLAAQDDEPLRFSEHFEAEGKKVFTEACNLGAEGIVSKLASAPYSSTRGNSWIKSKCFQEQEFVIGGFTDPSNGSTGIGALIIGYYENGKLLYAGRSGTGFTHKTQQTLHKQLSKLLQSKSPFANVPKGVSRGVHWVKPELVAQISFSNWTRDNLIRQAAFKGLREDKPAREVVREKAESPQSAAAMDSDSPKSPPHSKAGRTAHAAPAKSTGKIKTDLPITHPDKILDPESGMTKLMLANYLLAVADHMLPHVADRPLSILRCPEGAGKPCFFQKHIGMGLPPGIGSVPVPNKKNGSTEQYITLNSAQGLVGLAQMGVLEIHPWGSKNDSLEKPDRIIFDLDPDESIDWKVLGATASEFRARLEDLGLQCFLKTTGGKGLHVVAPIRPENEWPAIKEFAHNVVLALERKNPGLYVTKMTKAIRKNRIYLDYLRNDRGSTAIAPYSTRARSGAPVSLPLDWKELKSKTRPAFHVTDFDSWKKRLNSDPWAEMPKVKQRLTAKIIRAAEA